MTAFLEMRDLVAGYGRMVVLKGLNITMTPGEAVALIGHNGTGKSTILKSLSGQIKPMSGEILFDGFDVAAMSPSELVRRGLVQVPAGRRVFPRMSVLENLEAGAFTRSDGAGVKRDLDRLMTRFPKLAEKRRQMAGVLSGGEQQLLAIARGLMAGPKLLMIDEPSLGLSPLMVDQIFGAVGELVKEGMSLILAEQNVYKALSVTHRAFVLAQGKVVSTGTSAELLQDPEIRQSYLGLGNAKAFGALVDAALAEEAAASA